MLTSSLPSKYWHKIKSFRSWHVGVNFNMAFSRKFLTQPPKTTYMTLVSKRHFLDCRDPLPSQKNTSIPNEFVYVVNISFVTFKKKIGHKINIQSLI